MAQPRWLRLTYADDNIGISNALLHKLEVLAMSIENVYCGVLSKVSEQEVFWHTKIERAVEALSIPLSLKRRLDTLLFSRAVPSNLLLANQHVRYASRRAFMDTIIASRQANPSTPQYLVTFGGERGATVFAAPVMDLVIFQRAVYAALRRRGFTGLLSFEFDTVLRQSRFADHTVLFHCHGIVRPVVAGPLDVAALNHELASSAAFPPWDEAPGVDLRSIGGSDFDVCRTAAYPFDPIHQVKRVQPRRGNPERRMMRSTRDKFTPAMVLRATEIQSHLSVLDTVFGVDPWGTALRREWRKRLTSYLPSAAAQGFIMTSREITDLWHRIRSQDGSARIYEAVRIHTRSAMLRDRPQA